MSYQNLLRQLDNFHCVGKVKWGKIQKITREREKMQISWSGARASNWGPRARSPVGAKKALARSPIAYSPNSISDQNLRKGPKFKIQGNTVI